MSISFENYRMVHPYEDSDSSEDEVDWQDTRHDPYKAGNVHPFKFYPYISIDARPNTSTLYL